MLLVNLPTVDYDHALRLQETIVDRAMCGGPDVLLLLEHPRTITLGKRATGANILASADELAEAGIRVFATDRGGEATFHAPGQLVGYPIINLKRARLRVRDLVEGLETTMIRTLARFGVRAYRVPGKTGVWVGDNDKIGSIGLRIRRRVSYHGFSLNVRVDVDPADFMISCGMPSIAMVALNDVADTRTDVESVRSVTAECFGRVFSRTLRPTPAAELFAEPFQ